MILIEIMVAIQVGYFCTTPRKGAFQLGVNPTIALPGSILQISTWKQYIFSNAFPISLD
jgi:hypothetical protein